MMQIINNTGAIIGEQINLGNIDDLNIDDLFKDNTNNKKMKNNNYPNWLVPLDIAQQLKEIGFDEPTLFHYYEHDFDITIETNSYYDEGEAQGYLHFYISAFKEENFNRDKKCISIPTWEQILAWFRSKRFMITLINYEDESKFSFYNMKIRGGVYYAGAFKTYEGAREALVYKLIEIYKSEQNENLHLR